MDGFICKQACKQQEANKIQGAAVVGSTELYPGGYMNVYLHSSLLFWWHEWVMEGNFVAGMHTFYGLDVIA